MIRMKKWKLFSALAGTAAVFSGTLWLMQGPVNAVQAAAEPDSVQEESADDSRMIDTSVRVLPGARIAAPKENSGKRSTMECRLQLMT